MRELDDQALDQVNGGITGIVEYFAGTWPKKNALAYVSAVTVAKALPVVGSLVAAGETYDLVTKPEVRRIYRQAAKQAGRLPAEYK